MGESPAARALRENALAASDAIERHLDRLPLHLVQESFITSSTWSSIRTTSTLSDAGRAGRVLSGVEAKVVSEKGREWLESFLGILVHHGEGEVARNIAKKYGEPQVQEDS